VDDTRVTRVRELLQGLARRLARMEKECVRSHDVTFAHSHVIYQLGKHPGLSLGDLAGALGLDDSTVSRHVKVLAARGLLRATAAGGDHRQLSLCLTGAGEELYRRCAADMGQYVGDLFARIPAGKRDQLIESLGMLAAAMDKGNVCCGGPRGCQVGEESP